MNIYVVDRLTNYPLIMIIIQLSEANNCAWRIRINDIKSTSIANQLRNLKSCFRAVLHIEPQHEVWLSASNADKPISGANTQICNSSVSTSRHEHAPAPQELCDAFLSRVKGLGLRPWTLKIGEDLPRLIFLDI